MISPQASPKKINSFYGLADKAVDELKKSGLADTDRPKATPKKYGYVLRKS